VEAFIRQLALDSSVKSKTEKSGTVRKVNVAVFPPKTAPQNGNLDIPDGVRNARRDRFLVPCDPRDIMSAFSSEIPLLIEPMKFPET